MDKDKKIKEKKSELMQIYSNLPENDLKVAADLIAQAAFMAVTLEDLAENIAANGTVEEYTNGANQSGRKISSDAKLYSSLIAKYTTVITKLLSMVPEENRPEEKKAPELLQDEEQAVMMAKLQRQREREAAFCEALKNGKISQNEYRKFCDQWDKDHQQ